VPNETDESFPIRIAHHAAWYSPEILRVLAMKKISLNPNSIGMEWLAGFQVDE